MVITTVWKRICRVSMAVALLAATTMPLFGAQRTSAATEVGMVKDINPGPQDGSIDTFVEVNGTLYFIQETSNRLSLWKSNGTEAGTVKVKDLTPEGASAFAASVTRVGNLLMISFRLGAGGELWRSDGTTNGTNMVRDNIEVNDPVASGRAFYFTGREFGTPNRQLWKSTGTAEGTTIVKDVAADGTVRAGDLLYFHVQNDGLWRSDGSEAGTVRVKAMTLTGPLRVKGNEVFFPGLTNGSVSTLWKSDGTEAGTIQVKNVTPQQMLVIGDTLYFDGYPNNNQSDVQDGLWKSDGTEAGTVHIKNTALNPGTEAADITRLTNFNGKLLFAASDGFNIPNPTGPELWRSDGTTAGTVMVKEIVPGMFSPDIDSITPVGPIAYFAATTDAHGRELWQTDGTAQGTVLARDINPSGNSSPQSLRAVGDSLLFKANDGTHGEELWKATYTPAPDPDPPVVAQPTFTINPAAQGQTSILKVQATDAQSGVARVEYQFLHDDYDAMTPAAEPNTWQKSISTGGMGIGSYPVTVRAQDVAGNWSAPVSTRFAVTGSVSRVTTGTTRRVTPSTANGDVLPGLTSGQTAQVSFAFTTTFAGITPPTGTFSMEYRTGGVLCLLFPSGPNCHSTRVSMPNFSSLVMDDPGISRGRFEGTATVVVDGTTTTNPFRVVAYDGNRISTPAQDSVSIFIYAPNANQSKATPIYRLTATLPRTNITIQ